MYSPALGRFMQADPIGYQGGINLYAYVGNDPLNLTDPLGLKVGDWWDLPANFAHASQLSDQYIKQAAQLSLQAAGGDRVLQEQLAHNGAYELGGMRRGVARLRWKQINLQLLSLGPDMKYGAP